jgi:hypothetical protein
VCHPHIHCGTAGETKKNRGTNHLVKFELAGVGDEGVDVLGDVGIEVEDGLGDLISSSGAGGTTGATGFVDGGLQTGQEGFEAGEVLFHCGCKRERKEKKGGPGKKTRVGGQTTTARRKEDAGERRV